DLLPAGSGHRARDARVARGAKIERAVLRLLLAEERTAQRDLVREALAAVLEDLDQARAKADAELDLERPVVREDLERLGVLRELEAGAQLVRRRLGGLGAEDHGAASVATLRDRRVADDCLQARAATRG